MAEFRTDPLRGHTVLINGQRGTRPSEFTLRIETPDPANCAFCRGHEGMTPPSIEQDRSPNWNWRLFPNRYPAVLKDARPLIDNELTMAAVGYHEVLVESAEHFAQARDYTVPYWVDIFKLWQRRIRTHYSDPDIKYVHIFRNQGYRGGATLEHPHQQIVALPFVPEAIGKRIDLCRHVPRSCGYCRWIKNESTDSPRLLDRTDDLIAVTAFAPRFPFEWQIFPKRHDRFEKADDGVLEQLARLLSGGLRALDLACGGPDFNLVLFSSPQDTRVDAGWGVDILPRMSTQAGFEWGTGVHIVSTPPEEAAIRLRGFWSE